MCAASSTIVLQETIGLKGKYVRCIIKDLNNHAMTHHFPPPVLLRARITRLLKQCTSFVETRTCVVFAFSYACCCVAVLACEPANRTEFYQHLESVMRAQNVLVKLRPAPPPPVPVQQPQTLAPPSSSVLASARAQRQQAQQAEIMAAHARSAEAETQIEELYQPLLALMAKCIEIGCSCLA